MKTEIKYYQPKGFFEKSLARKINSEMNQLSNSLENKTYPFKIPENSGSAHIFYSSSDYIIVNFFKETDPKNARVSRGFNRINRRYLEKKLSDSIR